MGDECAQLELTERHLSRAIREGVADLAKLFRVNAGGYRGRMRGAPEGTPDLLGFRLSDGRFVAFEVKLRGQKPSPEQRRWLLDAEATGAVCGVVYTVGQARGLLIDTDAIRLMRRHEERTGGDPARFAAAPPLPSRSF